MHRKNVVYKRWLLTRLFQIRFRFLLVVGLFPVVLIAQWHMTKSSLVWKTDYYSYLYLHYSLTQTQPAEESLAETDAYDINDNNSTAIISSTLYSPDSNQPLSVVYVVTSDDSLLLDALQRSK